MIIMINCTHNSACSTINNYCLPGFQLEQPFAPSLLVEFRKRLTDEKLAEINEMIIESNKHDDDNTPPDNNGDNSDNHDEAGNDHDGTLIIDASCAP